VAEKSLLGCNVVIRLSDTGYFSNIGRHAAWYSNVPPPSVLVGCSGGSTCRSGLLLSLTHRRPSMEPDLKPLFQIQRTTPELLPAALSWCNVNAVKRFLANEKCQKGTGGSRPRRPAPLRAWCWCEKYAGPATRLRCWRADVRVRLRCVVLLVNLLMSAHRLVPQACDGLDVPLHSVQVTPSVVARADVISRVR